MQKKPQPKTPQPVIQLGDTDPKLLASAIVDVAASSKKLLHSGLTRKALALLISHSSGVGQRDVLSVLDAAADLGKYVRR